MISGSWGNTERRRGLFWDKKSHSAVEWGEERKLSAVSCCSSLSGVLSLEEVLALSQQTQIQLASTGLAKEYKRILPPTPTLSKHRSWVTGIVMALSICDDITTFGFMILINLKIQIASQSTTNLKVFNFFFSYTFSKTA